MTTQRFRFFTAGESHGQGLTAIIEGIPAGLELSESDIGIDLSRRQHGHGRGGRMKIEKHSLLASERAARNLLACKDGT